MNITRFNGYNPQEPELVGLTDCVDAMTDRAEAVLIMVQNQFIEGNEIKLKDEYIFQSLDSVLQEVQDIKSVVIGYSEFSRRKVISEDAK